jgi:hypothetical protein
VIICNPTGSFSHLSSTNHAGTEIHGNHASDAGIVYVSDKYILIGSSISPIFHAADGATGHTIASTSLNTFSKSSIIRVLTCVAFLK